MTETVRKEVIVHGSVEAIWEAWTTSAGLQGFLGVPARVSPHPGGAFEIDWLEDAPPGSRGTEGCTVLAVDPPRSLRFTWSGPPSIPGIRSALTSVTVTLEELPGGDVRVRLVDEGYGSGPDWILRLRYFDRAWEQVLGWLREHFPPPLP